MAKKYRFELGDKVRFTDTVKKERVENGVTYVSAGLPSRTSYAMESVIANRHWIPQVKTFNEGVIVGSRTLNDYYVEHAEDFGEYGVSYGKYTIVSSLAGTGKKAWLVAYDMRRNPVLVLDSHVKPLNNSRNI